MRQVRATRVRHHRRRPLALSASSALVTMLLTLALPLAGLPSGGIALARAGSETTQATANPTGQAVRALIVRYERGHAPMGTRVLGVSRVTGGQRENLVLGVPLGERMWQAVFTVPVSRATALRVARQLTSHPAVAFAEIDRPVAAVR